MFYKKTVLKIIWYIYINYHKFVIFSTKFKNFDFYITNLFQSIKVYKLNILRLYTSFLNYKCFFYWVKLIIKTII